MNNEAIVQAILTEEWFDSISYFDKLCDRKCRPTFSKKGFDKGGDDAQFTLDGILFNKAARALVTFADIEYDVPVPSHAMVFVDFVEPIHDIYVTVQKQPERWSLPPKPKGDAEWMARGEIAKTIVEKFHTDFVDAIARQDANDAWKIANKVAVEFLNEVAEQPITTSRGDVPVFERKLVLLGKRSNAARYLGEWYHKITIIEARLRELYKKACYRDQLFAQGNSPHQEWFEKYTELANKTYNLWCEITDNNMLPPCERGDLQVASKISNKLGQANSVADKRAEDSAIEARAKWVDNIRESSFSNKKECHRWLKGSNIGAPTSFVRPDNTVTSNTDEMHGMLGEFWESIYLKHQYKDFNAMRAQFLCKYRDSIEKIKEPLTLPLLDGQIFFTRAQKRPKQKAGGADMWTTEESHQFPPEIWQLYATICNLAEHAGVWPDAIGHIPEVCIDKDGSIPTPANVRCIGLNCIVYSIWASVRFQQSATWQQRVFPPELQGGISERCVERSEYELSCDIDDAESNDPIIAAFLDRFKSFDMLIPEISLAILAAIGFDPKCIKASLAYCSNQKRFFRLNQACGPFLRYANSAIQGCSFSVLMTNAAYSVWKTFLDEKRVQTSCSTFIDDAKFWSKLSNIDDLKSTWELTKQFDTDIGQVINESKTLFAAPSLKVAKKVVKKIARGTTAATTVKSLGFSQVFGGRASAKVLNKRLINAHRCLDRIASMPTNKTNKEYHILANAHPKWLYGTELLPPNPAQFRSLRAKVAHILWGRKKPVRIAFMVTAMAGNVLVDPEVAWANHVISKWRTLWFVQRDMAIRILKKTKECGPHNDPRKSGLSNVLSYLFHKLGWTITDPEFAEVTNKHGERFWIHQGSNVFIRRCIAQHVLESKMHDLQPRHDWTADHGNLKIDFEATANLIKNPLCAKEQKAIVNIVNKHGSIDNKDKAIIRSVTAGGVYNGQRLLAAKFRSNDKCPFCDKKVETFDHIFQECPAYQEIRDQHEVYTDNPISQRMGIVFFTENMLRITKEVQQRIVAPQGGEVFDCEERDLYLDGTCSNQTFVSARRAASAAVDIQGAHLACPLPGPDHTSPRSEIWAVIKGNHSFRNFNRMATDCMYVYSTVKLLRVHGRAALRWVDNRDLWEIMLDSLPAENLIKVKGHQTEQAVSLDANLRLHKIGNDLADKKAGEMRQQIFPNVFTNMFQNFVEAAQIQIRNVRILLRRQEYDNTLDPYRVDPDLQVEKTFKVLPTAIHICNCRPGSRICGKQRSTWCTGQCKFSLVVGEAEKSFVSCILNRIPTPQGTREILRTRFLPLFKLGIDVTSSSNKIKLRVSDPIVPARQGKNARKKPQASYLHHLKEFYSSFAFTDPNRCTANNITWFELLVLFTSVYGWPCEIGPPDITMHMSACRFAKDSLAVIDDNRIKPIKQIKHLKIVGFGDISGLNSRPIISEAASDLINAVCIKFTTLPRGPEAISSSSWKLFSDVQIRKAFSVFSIRDVQK